MVTPAAAASKNYVDKTPTFNEDATTEDLGTLYIKEDEVPLFSGEQITLTLLGGAEFTTINSKADVESYVKTSDGLTVSGVTYSDQSITFTINGGNKSADDQYVYIPFNDINIKDCSGEVKVKLDAFDSAITSAEYTIGFVQSTKVSVSILDVKTVSAGDTFAVPGHFKLD